MTVHGKEIVHANKRIRHTQDREPPRKNFLHRRRFDSELSELEVPRYPGPSNAKYLPHSKQRLLCASTGVGIVMNILSCMVYRRINKDRSLESARS